MREMHDLNIQYWSEYEVEDMLAEYWSLWDKKYMKIVSTSGTTFRLVIFLRGKLINFEISGKNKFLLECCKEIEYQHDLKTFFRKEKIKKILE